MKKSIHEGGESVSNSGAVIHTPGPWRFEPCEENFRPFDAKDWMIISKGGLVPCLAWGGAGFKEGEANAHLIAAAPDMLAALRFVADFYDPQLCVVADAIAKATGQKDDRTAGKPEGAPS